MPSSSLLELEEKIMRPRSLIGDLATFVQALLDHYSTEEIVQSTGIPTEDLERWRQGGNHYSAQSEWRLYSFCIEQQAYDLLKRYATVLPSFDLIGKNKANDFDFRSPPLGFDVEPPKVKLINRPTTI